MEKNEKEFTTSDTNLSEIIEIQDILQKYNISEEDEARILGFVKKAYVNLYRAKFSAYAILKLCDEPMDVNPDESERIDASID